MDTTGTFVTADAWMQVAAAAAAIRAEADGLAGRLEQLHREHRDLFDGARRCLARTETEARGVEGLFDTAGAGNGDVVVPFADAIYGRNRLFDALRAVADATDPDLQ